MKRFNPHKNFVGCFVPNSLLKYKGLSPSAKLLWARLAQYAGKNGYCYPSQERLAQDMGITKQQVINLLKELEKKGFIEREKPQGKDKLLHKTNRYFFLWHECFSSENCLSDNEIDRISDSTDSKADFTSGGQADFTSYNIDERESYERESQYIYRSKMDVFHKDIHKPKKKKFAENVSLSEEEYQKLVEKYGEEITAKCIEKLDNYKGALGRRYKSDYRAILNWVVEKVGGKPIEVINAIGEGGGVIDLR